ncbi:MAG: hypothetical protein QM647_07745 [Asticcacaulis sp.]|uniref:hypothetical protein n=1 Tax=Asticcacaulis sp. TaxID=1872648 RepID=UPI0039E4B54E
MPRPYPAPHPSHHLNPYVTIALLLATLAALLLPTAATAGDRDGYGRSTYYYGGEQYAGDTPYMDDSYHAQYDRYGYRSSGYRHGYTRSYERDYNGRDYACGCRYGRTAYYRTYNWKGEHEYRQATRQSYSYGSGSRYDDGY